MLPVDKGLCPEGIKWPELLNSKGQLVICISLSFCAIFSAKVNKEPLGPGNTGSLFTSARTRQAQWIPNFPNSMGLVWFGVGNACRPMWINLNFKYFKSNNLDWFLHSFSNNFNPKGYSVTEWWLVLYGTIPKTQEQQFSTPLSSFTTKPKEITFSPFII